MERLRATWGRFRVSTRIGAAIILALISVQAFAVAQFLLTPEPQWRVYSLRWLAEITSAATTIAFGSAVQERNALLRGVDSDGWLSISWRPHEPVSPARDADHPLQERIAMTLNANLPIAAKRVRVSFGPPRPGGPTRRPNTVIFVPTELEASLRTGALKEGQPDVPIPGFFRIDVQGPDETWITLAPSGGGPQWRFWPMLPLLGGTLVTVLLSLFTARRILSPLDHLTLAAQRIGTERTPTTIDLRGLGEFSAIAEAFNDMQLRLKRFVDDRTQMLAAISHDLRTSLTRLRLDVENVTAEEPRRALTREIDEMEAMISATLAFARGDAQGEPSRTIDLAALLISLCDDVTDRGDDASYSGPNHARICGQPMMMKRALANIVDNAVKYGQKVQVALQMTARTAIVRVSDDGPGIPAAHRQEAFAPFRRLETSRNRDTGGVGLGLTIARDVVHAHGGTIALGNRSPCGLIVTIVLPVQETLVKSA